MDFIDYISLKAPNFVKRRNFLGRLARNVCAPFMIIWKFTRTCLDARNTNKLPLIVNRFLRCKFLKILKCDQYTFWPSVSFKCRKKFNLGQRTPTNHRWRNLLDIYYYLTFFKNCFSVCLLFSLLFQIQWLFFYIFVLSSGYSSFT